MLLIAIKVPGWFSLAVAVPFLPRAGVPTPPPTYDAEPVEPQGSGPGLARALPRANVIPLRRVG